MRSFIQSLLVVAGLVSMPAWAVGERIIVSGAADAQLKETLCISMECVSSKSGGYSALVESKTLKSGGVEIRVVGADGKVRTTQRVPMSDQGRLSSTDLVSATSEIVTAIEDPNHRAKADEQAAAKPAKKKVKLAKKHSHGLKGIRLAARAHAPRG